MNAKTASTVVLIVDDDELVRKSLSVLVHSFGYYCLVAEAAEEAVRVMESTHVDLVLSDLVMPEMDGLELLAYIRKNQHNTDVIISTGYHEKISYAEVIHAGAIDFIKKPIDQAELEAKLARATRERRMLRELEKLSKLDSLTSIPNRRAYDEMFSVEVERAYRQNYPLMLAIVDIDNFKEYNDQYGHHEGDKVLVGLAEILKDCTRESVDVCFRLGGDEFAVLLPQATPGQGEEIVQRILQSYMEHGFGSTTLSIGLVSCRRNKNLPREEDDMAIKKLADQAMYEAKENGKNCVRTRS
ncbi:diguanylate cyclase domain-containing protein [Desulforhopalus singaporensis]|uniref:diguanylate cyclase n=1 Tax=Desulforhopalus singaporensis TaxID=91360 RepID=A0A1H0S7R0_9BACT|nr:diguanylate cyclase [Desulforhopalus singaporensis]SDP37760.1 response regulator receiver modulated diguanylate cyclase [Desulforhopalus singaporensis]